LDDGKQDDDDKEEESQIEEDAVNLVRIAVRRTDLVTCTHVQQTSYFVQINSAMIQ